PTPGERPTVAIDPSGLATVLVPGNIPQFVWQGIYAATGRRQHFGPFEVVANFPACSMNATSDAAGNTYVVWTTADTVCSSPASTVNAAVRPAGQGFTGSYRTISAAGAGEHPQVLPAGPAGAIAVWAEWIGRYDWCVEAAATGDTGGPPPTSNGRCR